MFSKLFLLRYYNKNDNDIYDSYVYIYKYNIWALFAYDCMIFSLLYYLDCKPDNSHDYIYDNGYNNNYYYYYHYVDYRY